MSLEGFKRKFKLLLEDNVDGEGKLGGGPCSLFGDDDVSNGVSKLRLFMTPL